MKKRTKEDTRRSIDSIAAHSAVLAVCLMALFGSIMSVATAVDAVKVKLFTHTKSTGCVVVGGNPENWPDPTPADRLNRQELRRHEVTP